MVPACESSKETFNLLSQVLTIYRGLAEHSHRSELATNIVNEMKADLASFLDIPDSYEVLIMQGASNYEPLVRSGLTL